MEEIDFTERLIEFPIEVVEIDSLSPHPQNYNTHSTEQIRALANSLRTFGQFKPIVVWRDWIVAGHGLVEGARLLGWDMIRVTMLPDDYPEELVLGIMAADNELARKSVIDPEKLSGLAALLNFKSEQAFDASGIDLSFLKTQPEITEPSGDDVPIEKEKYEGQYHPKLGEIWRVGDQYIACGDATDPVIWKRLLASVGKVDNVFTSPPYNLGDAITLRQEHYKRGNSAYGNIPDQTSHDAYFSLLTGFTDLALRHALCTLVNIQMLAGNKLAIASYMGRYADHLVDMYVWDKPNPQPAMAERVANSAFELVIVLSQEKEPTRAIETARFGRGTFSNVIHADKSKGEYALYHGAAFPLQFATHCIDNLCGETVLDPFCGSGTTLIACHQTGRTGYGIELSEEYCALILDRLCDEIGEGAMLYDAE